MVTMRGVQSGNGDAGLIGALAVEDTVATRTDGSQRLRRERFQPRFWTLRFQNHRSLTIVPRTPLITARTQATGANYVICDTGSSSRQTAC